MQLNIIEVNAPRGPRWIPGIFWCYNPDNFIRAWVLDYEVFILTKEEIPGILDKLKTFLDKKEAITFFVTERFDQ